ncbi:MAG: RpiB/LacA/LacB family sugar-phosphate isomerase, partial [Candidatus Wildermuthbacteria bacterium]|nr:RpiB/LacA/LacB family sugar-phosphate isomerase [Candidatus Wildermuthbacteria bacterium]
IVSLSRKHNDANILSIGARFVAPKQAESAVRAWLQTDFEGGRHYSRIKKLDA